MAQRAAQWRGKSCDKPRSNEDISPSPSWKILTDSSRTSIKWSRSLDWESRETVSRPHLLHRVNSSKHLLCVPAYVTRLKVHRCWYWWFRDSTCWLHVGSQWECCNCNALVCKSTLSEQEMVKLEYVWVYTWCRVELIFLRKCCCGAQRNNYNSIQSGSGCSADLAYWM